MWQYTNQALSWWCELQGQSVDEVNWQIYQGNLSLTAIIVEYLRVVVRCGSPDSALSKGLKGRRLI